MQGDMSLEDLDRYIKGFQQIGKWGWLPEMRKSLKFVRDNAKARIKVGMNVDGTPYPRLQMPKQTQLKVGDTGPIGIWGSKQRLSARQIGMAMVKGKGNAIYAKLYSAQQALKANTALGYVAMQKKKWIKQAKPIFRPVWKVRNKKSGPGSLYKALSEPSSEMGLHLAGRSFMHFGLKPYMWRHAGKHQFGGTGRNGEKIPVRQLLGATPGEIQHLMDIMVAGVAKREAKLAAKEKIE